MRPDTKTRLLDSAERLFAERGLDATSIRDVTRAAEANVAAVSFHFANKEGLVRAVFLRRLTPLVRQRIENLERLRAANSAPCAEDLLRAFLAPLVEMSEHAEPGPRSFLRLFARTLVEPAPLIEDLFTDEFGPYAAAYFEAFSEVIQGVSAAELADRLDFMIGTVGHALSDPVRRRLSRRVSGTGFAESAESKDELLNHLIHFVLAGLEAPACEPVE